MEEKKIATSVDILINVGSYEHIQITKYAEKKITYSSPEDMIKQEDLLTEELTNDIIRTMRALPNKLGKKTSANTAIEEKISKKIPEWMQNNIEPNIANNAKTQHDKNKANASAKVVEAKEDIKEDFADKPDIASDIDGDDLFD